MPDLFDYARTNRAAGIERAAEHAGPDWCDYAVGFLESFLSTHETMHVDELWAAGLVQPTSPRALGRVIQTARKNGWIETIPVPPHGIAARPSVRSNMQLKTVWQSTICRS